MPLRLEKGLNATAIKQSMKDASTKTDQTNMKAEGQEQLYKVTVASNKPNTNKKRSIGKQTALKRGRDTIASICQSFDTCV